MLICCLKLNSVFCFFTVYGQSTHSLPLNVLRHCHCLSLFEDLLFLDQLFFSPWKLIKSCLFAFVYGSITAVQISSSCLHVSTLTCMFVLRICLRTHACYSVSPLALIICGARPRAEVSGDPPTLILCVRVCVFVHFCGCVHVAFLLVLQSCSTANDPAKHLNDKEHILPAVLWATANKLVSQTLKVV